MIKKVFSVLLMTSVALFSFSTIATATPVPDTGQTQSYTSTFGEDSDYMIYPPSYTKIDASGNVLPDYASSWAMAQDTVTGLIWEEKHNRDSLRNYDDPNDADNTYSWYDGVTGVPDNARDTQDFINSLNARNYGGQHDWRLPTIQELSTLVNSSRVFPAIDTAFFTNTAASFYWSSTTDSSYIDAACNVDFSNGSLYDGGYKGNSYYVRAVRGVQFANASFVDNGNGTVTDRSTGLMWQQAAAPGTMTWEQALAYCENLTLAGHTDWRLPNRNELQSIVDFTRDNPAINTTFFPGTGVSFYWSSTTCADNTAYAWHVYFCGGLMINGNKSSSSFVRAVRGGPAPTVIELSSFTTVPKAGRIIIQWSTESETDNAGFNLYRSVVENGEYVKINDTIILSQGSSTQGASYQFIDNDAQNRKTYYYKLEDIDLSGNSTMRGPESATPRLIYGSGN
jgi:hypothetical protein